MINTLICYMKLVLINSHAVQIKKINCFVQVLTTLRFLAKWECLSEVADIHGISLSSASRIRTSVCNALCQTLDNVKFPITLDKLRIVKNEFYDLTRFSNVVGGINNTLIPIQGMNGDDEPNFTCREGFPVINVQDVVNAKLR